MAWSMRSCCAERSPTTTWSVRRSGFSAPNVISQARTLLFEARDWSMPGVAWISRQREVPGFSPVQLSPPDVIKQLPSRSEAHGSHSPPMSSTRSGSTRRRAGVRFCVEILNRYESNLVTTAAEARELMDQVGHPAVGIHLDCFHMSIEETDLGRQFAPRAINCTTCTPAPAIEARPEKDTSLGRKSHRP